MMRCTRCEKIGEAFYYKYGGNRTDLLLCRRCRTKLLKLLRIWKTSKLDQFLIYNAGKTATWGHEQGDMEVKR